MTEDEILKLAMRSHLVEGCSITANDYGFLSAVVQWNPVDETHFRQCLLRYTDDIIRLTREGILKDVTVTSKTNGEVVAVTLTDEEHRIYKVLWEGTRNEV